VKAYVVPVAGRTLRRDQVVELCEQRLARFKCPSVVEIVDTLPHTTTGKIARARLREQS